MPEAPPLAWPEPTVPAPPGPPARPDPGPWVTLAVILGAGLVVALVVALVAVRPSGEATTTPPSLSTIGSPTSRRSVSVPPPVTVAPSTSTPEPPGGWPVDLSVAGLRAALLTADDLLMTRAPAPPPEAIDTVPVEDLDADVTCEEMLRRYDAIGFRPRLGGGLPRAPRQAAVALAGPQGTVHHEIGDGLQVTVADIRDLFETCPEIGYTTGARPDSVSITAGTPIPVGDDSLSLEYTLASSRPGAAPVLWVLWERDSIISSIRVRGGDGDAPSLRDDAVEIADRRLEAIIG